MARDVWKDKEKVVDVISNISKANKNFIEIKEDIQKQVNIINRANGFDRISPNLGLGIANEYVDDLVSEADIICSNISTSADLIHYFDMDGSVMPSATSTEELKEQTGVFWSTAGMVTSKLFEGLFKGGEDLVDGAATLLGGITAWFKLDSVTNAIASFVEKDWVGDAADNFYQKHEAFFDKSVIKEDSKFAKVIEGIGYTGSFIVASSVFGGGTIANTVLSGVSSTGRTTENALIAGYDFKTAAAEGRKAGFRDAGKALVFDLLFRYGPKGAVKKVKDEISGVTKKVFGGSEYVKKATGEVADDLFKAKNNLDELIKKVENSKIDANNLGKADLVNTTDEWLANAKKLKSNMTQEYDELLTKINAGTAEDITKKFLHDSTKFKNNYLKDTLKMTKSGATIVDDAAQLTLKAAQKDVLKAGELYNEFSKHATNIPKLNNIMKTAKNKLAIAQSSADDAAKALTEAVNNAGPKIGFQRMATTIKNPAAVKPVVAVGVVNTVNNFKKNVGDISDSLIDFGDDSYVDTVGAGENSAEPTPTINPGGAPGYSGYPPTGGGGGSMPSPTNIDPPSSSTDTTVKPDTTINPNTTTVKPSDLATSVNKYNPSIPSSIGGSAGGRGSGGLSSDIPNYFDDFKEIDLEKLYGSEPDPIMVEPDIIEPYTDIVDIPPEVIEPEIVMPDSVQPDIITIPDDVPVEKTTDAGKILGVAAGTVAAAGAGIGAYSYIKNKKDEDFDEDGYAYEYEEESEDDSDDNVGFNTVDSVENI